MSSTRRALLLGLVLVAIPLSAGDYARRVDAVDLGVNECLDGGDLCVGKYVGFGFGRVLRSEPGEDVILDLRGGRRVTLVDWAERPALEQGLVVSVAGTYQRGGRVSVTRHQLHPRRRLKEWVGIAGLAVWLAGVALFVVGRLRGSGG